ncbi:Crp/Fnr family transcriptional regulator [Chryseobacterium sp.]|uniref:Crp/Fnr family transcriptional regulator n=1 Tax=Chryseobacterium sp. TaxID=1871047 RepID=UPI0028A0DA44|nr:Crp/Fnr family transcriptional regulator [Chryseobacterium sp.]
MVIDEEILFTYGAEIQNYKAGEPVFIEGSVPKFYYQIRSGLVKLNVYKDDGSEFIHSLPSAGHCIAETFLWYDVPYCINAITMNDVEVIRLKKDVFLDLVNERSDLMSNVMAYTSERMFNRYRMLTTLSVNNPSYKILNVLDFLKSHHNITEPFEFIVPFSRQQLGALTGLRVETVIRTVKKLEKQNLVKISNGKICF